MTNTRRAGAIIAGFVALACVFLFALAGCGGGGGSLSGGNGNNGGNGNTNGGNNGVVLTNGTNLPGNNSGNGNSNNANGNNANGNNGTPAVQTRVNLPITWGARGGRGVVTALNSALSATITLAKAKADGTDLVFIANRDRSRLEGYTDTYTSTDKANVGTYPLTVNFYANPDGTGALVGTAQIPSVPVPADGTLSVQLSINSVINRIVVAPNQVLKAGATAPIVFTAYDSSNNVVPVTPGSAVVTVTSGYSFLGATGNTLSGIRPGSANVTVVVDGVTSTAQSVSVSSDVVVTITPNNGTDPANPQTVFVATGTSLKFSATVLNLPAGLSATDQGVIWSIAEGTRGGTITQDGTYTAPALPSTFNGPDTYTIIATSIYDPGKSASVKVTVDLVLTVTPNPGSVVINGTLQFTANTSVTWAVEEANGGTIDANGLYTAPAQRGTYHIIATSTQYSGKTLRVTVNVLAGNQPITVN